MSQGIRFRIFWREKFMTKDQKIAKLAREISDYYATMLRLKEVTPESPEYLGINSALKFTAVKYDQKMADDILDIALTMKKRIPMTFEQIKEDIDGRS